MSFTIKELDSVWQKPGGEQCKSTVYYHKHVRLTELTHDENSHPFKETCNIHNVQLSVLGHDSEMYDRHSKDNILLEGFN